MGKSYYCEYCDKRMKFSVSIRKKHNEGLPHKIARANYMARYQDPRETLSIERDKLQCNRFLNGKECKYGMMCHFTHYSADQLKELEKISERLNNPTASTSKSQTKEPAKQEFPWKYPYGKLQNMNIPPTYRTPLILPPSLQPYDVQKCMSLNGETEIEWG